MCASCSQQSPSLKSFFRGHPRQRRPPCNSASSSNPSNHRVHVEKVRVALGDVVCNTRPEECSLSFGHRVEVETDERTEKGWADEKEEKTEERVHLNQVSKVDPSHVHKIVWLRPADAVAANMRLETGEMESTFVYSKSRCTRPSETKRLGGISFSVARSTRHNESRRYTLRDRRMRI